SFPYSREVGERTSHSTGSAEHAEPVLAEDLLDVVLRPAAAHELFGHERESGRAVESGDRAAAVEPVEVERHRRWRQLLEHLLDEVRAEPDLVDARDPGDVLDVVDQTRDGRRIRVDAAVAEVHAGAT